MIKIKSCWGNFQYIMWKILWSFRGDNNTKWSSTCHEICRPVNCLYTLSEKIKLLYSHSNRCSSQWRQCVRAWRGSVRLPPGVAPRGSRALKAGCCRLGAQQQLGGRPVEGRHRYWPRAERLREACTHLPPRRHTHAHTVQCYILGGMLLSSWFYSLFIHLFIHVNLSAP